MYATGVGLVMYGFQKAKDEEELNIDEKTSRDESSLFSLIVKKLKSWVKEMF